MPRFFKLKILGATSLALISTTALAAPAADLNGDQKIDQVEFITHAAQRFTKIDTNSDGLLSQDEVKAHRKARNTSKENKRFNALDTNNDGMISKDEYTARTEKRAAKRAERRLKLMDTNGDGTISDAEKNAYKAQRLANMAEKKADRKTRRADRAARISPDSNGDGFITRAEFDASSKAIFARLDANNDGVLTQGEGRHRKKKGPRHGPNGH